MPNTDRFSLLERWANGAEAFRDAMETKYGPAPTPPQLPPYTTYDAMLEAIVDNTVGAKRLLNKKSPTYHSDSAGYTKVVPAGDVHYASLDSIGGKTVVFNQLTYNGNFANDTDGWERLGSYNVSLSASDDVLSVTVTGYYDAFYNIAVRPTSAHQYPLVSGHKYYVTLEAYSPYDVTLSITNASTFGTAVAIVDSTGVNTWTKGAKILTSQGTGNYSPYFAPSTNWQSFQTNDVYKLRNIMFIDLTLMFGAGNEPSTVQEFQQTFPASYYPYNAGTLLSAGVTSVVSNSSNLINPANYYSTNVDVDGILTTRSYGGNYGDLYTASNGQTTAVPLNYIPKLPYLVAGTYTLAVDEADAYIRVYTVDNAGNVSDYIAEMQQGTNKSATFTLASNTHITLRKLAGGVSVFKYLRLTKSGSALPYSPYGTIATYPIPAEIQALEGYGWSAGSVYNYIDYERKVFVKRVDKIVLDGTQTLSATNWRPDTNGVGWLYPYSLTNNAYPTSTSAYANIVSTKFMRMTYGGLFAHYQGIGVFNGTSYGICIWQSDTTLTTATAINNYLSANPITVYYELETPVETDISAYLTDDNLIEVESGGTLTFPNSNGDDYTIPVPSSETFVVGEP